MLVSLANSLLDGTVFQIVAGSADLQRIEEEELFVQRKKVVNDLVGKLQL